MSALSLPDPRYIAMLLAVPLALPLVACGGGGNSDVSKSPPAQTAAARVTRTAVAQATATAVAAIPTEFTSVPPTVTRGQNAQISVHTKPRARCDVAISYRNNPSHPDQPGPQRADNDGNVSWSWTVNPDAEPGPAAAIVSCDYDVLQTSFTVT